MIKRTIALSLSLALGAAVNAAPAPVTDLSDASIEQRLTIVERMVSSRANSQHRIQEQLDTMQDEVNELRGSIELHNHQLEKILERQRELYLEIDKRIEAVSSQALKDKQYDLAIPQFQAFITKFPNSSYAPNAHYWLGQLLFNKQDWSGAGEQFQVLISGYPDSTKRADAIFKLGVVEQKRSNLARAKQLFEQVISEYPDSSSKKLAETRLSNLN
jgi:tol-pal system protein YbgF